LKRNYTLHEIIISIIALAFVGVFAARMYMQANNLQNKARDLDMMSLAAQSVVEAFKSDYTLAETVYFNRDFRVVPEIDENGFVLTMEVADDGMGFFNVNVDVIKVKPYHGEAETCAYALTTSVYRGSGKGSER